MDRRTICRRLHSIYGKGLITTNEIARFMGLSRSRTMKLLEGLDYVVGSYNTKTYLIDDVADMIMRNRG